MEKHHKIRRIIEFMNIPDFELIISAKVRELEVSLKPQIHHYLELKAKFKEFASPQLALLEKEARERSDETEKTTHYFEMTQPNEKPLHQDQWEIWELQPIPKTDLIDTTLNRFSLSLHHYQADPDKIHHLNVPCPDHPKSFDLRFTKYSDFYAFGVIRESHEVPLPSPPKETHRIVKLNLDYRTLKKEDIYSELLRYLDTYPQIRERLLAYFYIIEKPAADTK